MNTKANYFTEKGVEVSKRIKNKVTELVLGTDVHTELEAYEIAKKRCTYHYSIFSDCLKTNRRVHVGFGIPK
ncbi:hypothetical protein TPENAI_60886 [Tenacibaculum litopenaei]|uniref:hypothetical protein n=1 Tax=Tenacibaculum litopenaei TaxID=396016 RepID=UPI003894F399